MARHRQWHRWFGASWRDFVTGQPVAVEVEFDTSKQQQFLDVLLLRREGPLTIEMPDGFDDLGYHNLIGFKSFQETFDEEAVEDLLGHFTAYRKLASAKPAELLPRDQFRRYAVSARFPENLGGAGWLTRIGEGVYEIPHFTGTMRLIVLSQLPMVPRNAALLRFSADQARWGYAAQAYAPRSPQGSMLLRDLFHAYDEGGLPMPYTAEQQLEDSIRSALEDATPEQLIKWVPVEKRLEAVPVEKRLEGVPVEKRLEGLSPEERAELLRLLTQDKPAP
ncbi:MAG: hypothetical protein K2W96_08845 [Gemmataceae bacterium]|nr:hypothetical protein [Gemmataceae bacterium]